MAAKLVESLKQRWPEGNSTSAKIGYAGAPITSGEGVLAMALAQSIALAVSKRDVNSADCLTTLAALLKYIATPDQSRANLEGLDTATTTTAGRSSISRLDSNFLLWLFFTNKRFLGLQALTLCFMPAYPTPEQRKKTFPEFLSALLTNCPDVG